MKAPRWVWVINFSERGNRVGVPLSALKSANSVGAAHQLILTTRTMGKRGIDSQSFQPTRFVFGQEKVSTRAIGHSAPPWLISLQRKFLQTEPQLLYSLVLSFGSNRSEPYAVKRKSSPLDNEDAKIWGKNVDKWIATLCDRKSIQ